MNVYAVIETGGKQHLVHQEDVFNVERLRAEAGSDIELKPVLAVSDGTTLTIGRPSVENASVKAVIVEHIRGPKVIAFKMKRRKGYRRKKGHPGIDRSEDKGNKTLKLPLAKTAKTAKI